MSDTGYVAYKYCNLVVIIFGILGNTLVVISILGRRNVLKEKHYFLVVQLAICDLGALTIFLLNHTYLHLLEKHIISSKHYCLGYFILYFFQVSGLGMMLMISVLRYRAVLHPLKPAISRRKLKVVCGLVYIAALIMGYGSGLPLCYLPMNDVRTVYIRYLSGYIMICFLLPPTIFMAVVYFKVGRALIEQNMYIKSVCSNPAVAQSAPTSSFNILTFFRNRKIFFVCMLVVVCFTIGNILLTAELILRIAGKFRLPEHYWIVYWDNFFQAAFWHSANPLIYGILDKTLLKFWKRRSTRKRRSPEH